jgi:pyruvate, water dikinase
MTNGKNYGFAGNVGHVRADGKGHGKTQDIEPRPIDMRGFLSVISQQMLSPPNPVVERFGDRSYAIISDKYMNFSSRVGYYYSILDTYCGQTSMKNYINFQFKGGGLPTAFGGTGAPG